MTMPDTLTEYLAAQPGRCTNGFDIKTQHPRYCRCRATLRVAPQVSKAEALARTNAGANDDDKARIDAAILAVAQTGRAFSANDFRDRFPDIGGGIVGARVSALAKKHKWDHLGTTPSTKPNTHGHPIGVWRIRAA